MSSRIGHHDLPPRPQDGPTINFHSAHNLPPPSPPADIPPMYQFGSGSYGPDRIPESRHREQNEFSFRHNHDHAIRFPDGGANSSTSNWSSGRFSRQDTGPHHKRSQQDAHRDSRGNRYQNGANSYGRGRGRGFTATAERPLLRSNRGSTPEQMNCMTSEQGRQRRFMVPEDISDSEEKEMEESEPEGILQPPDIGDLGTPTSVTINGQATEEATEPARKKRIRELTEEDCASVDPPPKWSNPDPYTVLPPPDESQKKRKDVVKLIRRARIATEQDVGRSNALVDNDDFISLNFENGATEVSDTSDVAEAENEKGVPGAPTGPRQFSHLSALHGPSLGTAPGVSGDVVSAAALGPPPGIATTAQANDTRADDDVWPPPDTAAALGSRKRTRDDQIKGEAPPRQKNKRGGRGSDPDGAVVPEWKVNGTPSDTPWCAMNYARVENIGYGFHQEICDFYDFVRPREYEDIIRDELLKRLRYIISKNYEYCDIRCFGSFAAGLYLPNADMDLVVVSEAFMDRGRRQICQTNTQMRRFASFLSHEQVPEPGSVEMIFGAKVPLIKFVDRITGLKVDVSFENDTGIIANRTFASWKAQFPAMPIIVTIVKQFLMMRGLNDVATGGLGGFSVTCLVTSLLQNMPEVQRGTLIPEHHLGLVLMEFFNLYGNEFNTTTTGIRMSPPFYFDKRRVQGRPYQANKLHRLAIIDPNRSDNDISGGTRNILTILEHFSDAHRALQQRMASLSQAAIENQGPESILGTILAGNYSSFKTQRGRLRRLYEERFGKFDLDESQDSIQAEVATLARAFSEEHGRESTQSVMGKRNRKHKLPKKVKPKQGSGSIPFDEEGAKPRATAVKNDYSGIQDVPPQVTRNMRKLLIADYRATVTAPQHNGPMQPRSQYPHPRTRRSRGGKKTKPLPEASQDVPSSSLGYSAENPIDLD